MCVAESLSALREINGAQLPSSMQMSWWICMWWHHLTFAQSQSYCVALEVFEMAQMFDRLSYRTHTHTRVVFVVLSCVGLISRIVKINRKSGNVFIKAIAHSIRQTNLLRSCVGMQFRWTEREDENIGGFWIFYVSLAKLKRNYTTKRCTNSETRFHLDRYTRYTHTRAKTYNGIVSSFAVRRRWLVC